MRDGIRCESAYACDEHGWSLERGPDRPRAGKSKLSDSTLAVPVAFSKDGSLIRPSEAREGQQYRCAGCGADVVLRIGKLRRPHFAHRGGDSCSSESALHRAAKHVLLRVIEEWKAGTGPRPCVSRPCPRYTCEGGIVQDVPDDVTHAAAEVRLVDGSIADIVLYRGRHPAVAIEILATHRVGHEKASRLRVPWMELRAQEVLDRPYWWVAVQDGLRPFSCPACAKRDEAAALRLREIQDCVLPIARRLHLSLPSSPPYHYVAHECWRCKSSMVAFLWPGGGARGSQRPPAPIPASVQHCATDGGGNYWANCCPDCSVVQGDYYLARDNEHYMFVRELSQDVLGPLGTEKV